MVVQLGGSYSFRWWPPSELLVVPLISYWFSVKPSYLLHPNGSILLPTGLFLHLANYKIDLLYNRDQVTDPQINQSLGVGVPLQGERAH